MENQELIGVKGITTVSPATTYAPYIPQLGWQFKKRNEWWEAYMPPNAWPHDLPIWLFNTFGEPVRNGTWDYHGGWIKFKERKHVDWFLLRWT